ncbi:alpha-2-macroglobulin family protein [Archangium violaceum]|uniref:alpha-2-macroglobulin family protein n=1 Tax=Archangium violaceum TaxID=83451 RepID=UPI0036D8B3BE
MAMLILPSPRTLAALLTLLALVLTVPAAQGQPSVPSWKDIDALVEEQKLEAAVQGTEARLAQARAQANEDEWTRALVRVEQLRTALHGEETAVRFLREQPWPEGLLPRTALHLYYASSLIHYAGRYGWEIRQREQVVSGGPVDLKRWTAEQIYTEARRALAEVWGARERLGSRKVGELAGYLAPNTYPPGIRDTLRDAVTYLWVEMLSDEAQWRPEQSSEVHRLDLGELLEGTPRVDLVDPAVHPLRKLAAVLGDLEAWHRASGQREAALEAQLRRGERLLEAFQEESDKARIRRHVAGVLEGYRDVPWWAMGQGWLAEQEEWAERPVRAHAIAKACAAAFPESLGGQRCARLVTRLEAPDFSVSSMRYDGVGKRSIEVTHRNLPRLYFRAYAYDLEPRLERGDLHDELLMEDGDSEEALLRLTASERPVAAWSASLPGTPDLRSHRTFVVPPLKEQGSYLIVASAREDFRKEGNALAATLMTVTPWVFVSRYDPAGRIEVRVVEGESGRPSPGVEVRLFQAGDGRNQMLRSLKTDARGEVVFPELPDRMVHRLSLAVGRGRQVLLDQQPRYVFGRESEKERTRALVFTDRGVYRPLQQVLWKVVAFRGSGAQARYRTLPEQRLTVSLEDANGQIVEKREVGTNGFGSVAGGFTVPAGRLLGGWRVRAQVGEETVGHASVRVEEYKRPTFEVTVKDPDAALRLNRPATFRGEARYFFGLPVTHGSVRWRVHREPLLPWWWFRSGGSSLRSRVVASGTSALEGDGNFQLTFTPEADERALASREVSWRYRVEADVTDEGGETRSASRAFRLGLVAVEGRVETDEGFFREGVPAEVRLVRANLDGVPLPGAGRWRLVSLKQPSRPLMPDELPPPRFPEQPVDADAWVTTPGDLSRPRWLKSEWEEEKEEPLRGWKDGEELSRGEVTHDARGLAQVKLPRLRPGAYRVHYETEDAFGERFTTSREVVVAGEQVPIPLPALLRLERTTVKVGETARVLAFSGFEGQPLFLDVYQGERFVQRHMLMGRKDPAVLEVPVTESLRGGFTVSLVAVRDYQVLRFEQPVSVPFDDKELRVEFATFRDRVRPGAKETWRVTVKGPAGAKVEAGAAELLAYMYDRSLDLFAPHAPQNVAEYYPQRTETVDHRASPSQGSSWWLTSGDWVHEPKWVPPREDALVFEAGHGVGGPGRRGLSVRPMVKGFALMSGKRSAMPKASRKEAGYVVDGLSANDVAFGINRDPSLDETTSRAPGTVAPSDAVRARFEETAFWVPQLLTGEDGSAVLEFTVPDSVTAWNVWVHALTRDLKGGSLQRQTRSVKELMVRPYVPRFLREGDRAVLEVAVNNAGEAALEGSLVLDIVDPETDASQLSRFGVEVASQPFRVEAGKGTTVRFPLKAPAELGPVAFRVTARAGDFSDGELRPLPVLPGRMHLTQSRFVTLRGRDREVMEFADLRRGDDPSLLNEQLVVTVDAQPFHAVLGALPYLVDYPYECTEQTLNRFVSTGIVSSLYDRYPEVAKLAKSMSTRTTRFETWDAVDPNRKMALEESPWLEEAQGGSSGELGLAKVLDPEVANAEREAALTKLRQAQLSSGAFPWWPGGPPSPYMTLYILHGLARASEHGVTLDPSMTRPAWAYLAKHFRSDYAEKLRKAGCCWEFLTLLEYVASSFPDASYMGDALSAEERARIRDFSFQHWKEHSPYLKGYLALALKRAGRERDARRVFESVMDSAKTSKELGTYWAPEERSWLWYNDTTETHAFALRTLLELNPKDERRHGLAQWLLLNRKLGHWKSTRATAEAVYALVKYLEREGTLGAREDAKVTVGGRTVALAFAPEVYTGKGSRVVVPGPEVNPETSGTVVVEKEGKGMAFASATWHFSTERLPDEERGDFFHVSRRYFLREQTGTEAVLRPLEEGTRLVPGDEVEVHLSLRTKHAAEYVHLRDPRAAGMEPASTQSRHRYDLEIVWYEEPRDSGTNFFFEWLPAGEYTFRYRLRANMAGTFRVGPATVQSMYAPEFTAYSKGAVLEVGR